MQKAKKIFVGNYKGGVGKTTSIYQIAFHMVERGKRVLLIDLDPQCSLSEICLARIDLQLDQLQPYECLNYIYDMWNERKEYPQIRVTFDKSNLIKKTNDNIHFIPSNIFDKNGGLDGIALRLENSLEDLVVLQQFFQNSKLEEDYDYILFDCPPSNNVITQGAFLQSDYYIIPSIIQTMSIRGVVHYIKTVEKIYQDHCAVPLAKVLFGKKPELIGIFETIKDSRVNNENEIKDLKGHLKKSDIDSLTYRRTQNHLLSTIINKYEIIARDTGEGKKRPEYEDLTDEILDCLEQDNLF